MLEKNKDKVSKPILDLISKKDEFSDDEWKKIQSAIQKLFKGFK